MYTQRRAVQALKDMYQAGKITAEEYQQAAATHAGPVWEQALQAEALKTGPSTLGSWATGLKVKETTPSDQEMLRMRQTFLLSLLRGRWRIASISKPKWPSRPNIPGRIPC